MALCFLNVDIELRTSTKPRAFLRALRRDEAAVLRSDDATGDWIVAFEVRGVSDSASQVLKGLKRFFASLTPGARAEWDGADQRIFDFGFEIEGQERSQGIDISPRFVAFAGSVKAMIRVTVYDHRKADAELAGKTQRG